MPSRLVSRVHNVSGKWRVRAVQVRSPQPISSLSDSRSSSLQKPCESTFEILSPEMKHKCHALGDAQGLGIDGELASLAELSQPSSRVLTPLPESKLMKTNGSLSSSSVMGPSEPLYILGFERDQFLDELRVCKRMERLTRVSLVVFHSPPFVLYLRVVTMCVKHRIHPRAMFRQRPGTPRDRF